MLRTILSTLDNFEFNAPSLKQEQEVSQLEEQHQQQQQQQHCSAVPLPEPPPPHHQQQQQPSSHATWTERCKQIWKTKVHSNINHDSDENENNDEMIQCTNTSDAAALTVCPSLPDSSNSRAVPTIAVATRGAARRLSKPVVVVTPAPVEEVAEAFNSRNDDNDFDDDCSLLKAEHAKRKEELRNLVAELQTKGHGVGGSFMSGIVNHDKTTRHDEKALEILTSLLRGNNSMNSKKNHHNHAIPRECNKSVEELKRYREELQVRLLKLQEESVQIDQDVQRILDWSALQVYSQQTLFSFHTPRRRPNESLLYHSYDSEEKRPESDDDCQTINDDQDASFIVEKPITLPPHQHGKILGNPNVIHYLINLVQQIDGDYTIVSLNNNADHDSTTSADVDGTIMTLTVQLLKRHVVEIRLQIVPIHARIVNATASSGPLVLVKHARFITSPYLRGGGGRSQSISKNTNSGNDQQQYNQNKKPPLSPTEILLEIPPLNDLVQMAHKVQSRHDPNNHDGASGLRLLLEEIKSRIQTMQLRVRELSRIEKHGHARLTKIGSITTTMTSTSCQANQQPSNTMATEDNKSTTHYQRIVCVLPGQHLRVVLLLGPDCPTRAGSVTLDQLCIVLPAPSNATTTTASSGPCFWENNSRSENDQILHEIRSKLWERRHGFKSPSVLIQAIQHHATEIMDKFRRQRHQVNKERRKKQQEELVGAS